MIMNNFDKVLYEMLQEEIGSSFVTELLHPLGVYKNFGAVVSLSNEAVEWFVNHIGISVTHETNSRNIYINEKYRKKERTSPNAYDYYNLNLDNLVQYLNEYTSIFVESDQTIKVPNYYMIYPKYRRELENIVHAAGRDVFFSYQDKKYLKTAKIKNEKDFYHYEKSLW